MSVWFPMASHGPDPRRGERHGSGVCARETSGLRTSMAHPNATRGWGGHTRRAPARLGLRACSLILTQETVVGNAPMRSSK